MSELAANGNLAPAKPGRAPPVSYRRYFVLLAFAWSVAVAVSFGWNLVRNEAGVKSLTTRTAQALLEKDLLYREWSILHGGVYIPKSSQPESVSGAGGEEREIVTPSGQTLTLLNPAAVSRQVFELQERQTGIRGHLTSLKPLRAANRPDDWERRSLEAFEKGLREVSSIETLQGERCFRMMRPLVTVPACLRCHEEAGRKPGEIRGGISVTVPMNRIATREENLDLSVAQAGLWLIGLLGLLLGLRNLEHHSRERRRAEEALNHELGLTGALTENASTAIFLQDQHGRCTLMNPAAEAMTGYKFEEVRGKLLHDAIHHLHRDGTPFPPGDCAILSAVLERKSFRNKEDLFVRKDRTTFPVLCALSPIVKEGVLSGVVLEAQDITDRKLAEERTQAALREKEALLQEIHHRVKNNLQVISSLLQLQINEIRDPQTLGIFRESQLRIRSMALIHEKLYESDSLAEIDLADYLRSLTNLLFSTYASAPSQVRLKLNLSQIFISINTAIPLGLIANELITNSLKFAFPDGRQGIIRVELGAVAGDRFRLRIADDGVGLPKGFAAEKSASLGMRLVRMLSSQLDGEGAWETVEAGASFTLEFRDKVCAKKNDVPTPVCAAPERVA